MRAQEPEALVADGEGFEEVGFGVGVEGGEGGGRGGEEGRGFVDDEGLVEILEVVYGSVLRGGDVDAHCDCGDEGGDGGDGGEGGHLAGGWGADFVRPGLDGGVGGDLGVGFVGDGDHGGDEGVDGVPHEVHVFAVGVVFESGSIQLLEGEAAGWQVVGDIFALEVETFEGILKESIEFIIWYADKVEYYLGHQGFPRGSVE